jgi:uncharacterized protein (DUF302 family)
MTDKDIDNDTGTPNGTDNGLVTSASPFSVSETMQRFAAAVTARGMTVFARFDHADGAANAGLRLRPTELLLFGHPKGGTPLMQDQQTAGIDLPLKALAWEDADGKVWLTRNSARWIAQRHGLGETSAAAVQAMEQMMSTVAQEATTARPR